MPLKEVARRGSPPRSTRSPGGPARSTPWSAATTGGGTPRTPTSSAGAGAPARTCPRVPGARWSSARAPRRAPRCSRSPSSASRPSRSGPATPAGPPTCSPGRSTWASASATARSPRSGRGSRRATTSSSRPCRPRPARRSRPRPCRPTHRGVLLDVVYAGWPTPLARAAARAGMTVVSGPGHARAPGGGAVPPVHRPRRAGRGDGRRGAGGAGADVTPVGGARRGPRHGRRRPPHRAGAGDRWVPDPGGRGRPPARAELVARARDARRSPRWPPGRSVTWPAGRRCRPTCSSPGSPSGWSGSTSTCTGCPSASSCRPGRGWSALLAVRVGRHRGPAVAGRRSSGASSWAAVYLLLAVLPGGGVGGGDVRLAPLIGALLGWLGVGELVVGLRPASSSAGVAAVALLAARRAGLRSVHRLRAGDVPRRLGRPSRGRPGS